MATQTVRIAVPDNNYVEVSNGHFNVFLRPFTPVALRLHVGQIAPAAGTEHYMPISASGVSLSDLEGGDKVYLRAEAPGAFVTVIRA